MQDNLEQYEQDINFPLQFRKNLSIFVESKVGPWRTGRKPIFDRQQERKCESLCVKLKKTETQQKISLKKFYNSNLKTPPHIGKITEKQLEISVLTVNAQNKLPILNSPSKSHRLQTQIPSQALSHLDMHMRLPTKDYTKQKNYWHPNPSGLVYVNKFINEGVENVKKRSQGKNKNKTKNNRQDFSYQQKIPIIRQLNFIRANRGSIVAKSFKCNELFRSCKNRQKISNQKQRQKEKQQDASPQYLKQKKYTCKLLPIPVNFQTII